MTETPPLQHGALAHSRVWRAGKVIDDDITPEEMLTVAHDPSSLVWLDLVAPSPTALAVIAEDLALPPTAVEDALAPHERAKITRHESHLFFTVYAARLDQSRPSGSGRLRVDRISGIVLPMALVTIRLDADFDMEPVIARWEESPDLLRRGSGALVHGLMDHVVDGHFATIQQIDDELENLEDVLFEERPSGQQFQRTVYSLRKDLVQLRRIVLPMREVVNGVLRHSEADAALRPWFDDLYDHVLRASEWTESLRDMVTSIFETNLSLQDARLNTIMKKLAGWAAIIAVPTAITGWFGQNVPYPGFAEPLGLWLSAALIAIGGVALYFVFRAHDWL
nr:magnesium transporter CorA family protein [Propionibacterium sp.]